MYVKTNEANKASFPKWKVVNKAKHFAYQLPQTWQTTSSLIILEGRGLARFFSLSTFASRLLEVEDLSARSCVLPTFLSLRKIRDYS